MPFDLSVIRGGVTYSLSAGTPYKLLSAEGLAGPALTRATMRAPGQDGDTDYGYHLEPRLITLAVSFSATSGSVLDGYRDTFMDVFRPERSASFSNPTGDPRFQAYTPLTLQVTRDDGEVRRIDCYATGPADVPLVTEFRPGSLHRAVVTLVAPNPTWYGTANVSNGYLYANTGTPDTTLPYQGTVAYTGSYYAQPIITIIGSITAPVITNLQTGNALNFGSVDLQTVADTLVVNTFTSYAEVNGTAVVPTGSLNLQDLNLAPSPIVTGGTNTIRVTATSSSTDTFMSIQHRPRYLSY